MHWIAIYHHKQLRSRFRALVDEELVTESER